MIEKETLLMRKVDWQGKFIGKKSLLMRKVDWQGKLIDKESWLRKVEERMLIIVPNKQMDNAICYEVAFATEKNLHQICYCRETYAER